MSIAEKLSTVSDNVQRVYVAGYNSGYADGEEIGGNAGFESGYNDGYLQGLEKGRTNERDFFWNEFQKNGERASYNYAFYGEGWSDVNFYPKYDIRFGNDQMVFESCKITDLKQRLIDCGVKMIFGDATQSLYYFFRNAPVTHLPEIGGKSVISAQGAFQTCTDLQSIEKLTLSDTANCPCNSAFRNCLFLEEIRFNQGIRPTSLSLQWSTKLSKASLASMNEDGKGYGLIPALSDDVTGSITVSATAVSAAFPDRAEWDALCNTKPTWTITEA